MAVHARALGRGAHAHQARRAGCATWHAHLPARKYVDAFKALGRRAETLDPALCATPTCGAPTAAAPVAACDCPAE